MNGMKYEYIKLFPFEFLSTGPPPLLQITKIVHKSISIDSHKPTRIHKLSTQSLSIIQYIILISPTSTVHSKPYPGKTRLCA